MKKNIAKGFIYFTFLFFMGCATLPHKMPAPYNQHLSWERREATLTTITSWDIEGLTAVRTPDNAWTANLQWQQHEENYALSLWGPLGVSSFQLRGAPGNVILKTGAGKTYRATSPEELLAKETGWILPVSHLFYWVRGLPVPNMPSNMTFDPYHHIKQLNQAGWTIRYLSYTSAKHTDLPAKIYITHPPLQLKIVIHEWK